MNCIIPIAICIALAASTTGAVNGIAVTTHRATSTGDWHGFGVDTCGSIVRHDIVNSRVVRNTVIYPTETARCVVFNQPGTMVAFVKLLGKLQVMNIDGTGLRELPSQNIAGTSWIDWPDGDWVYYSQRSIGPDCATWNVWDNCVDADKIRRVNVATGADELVASIGGKVWQLGVAAGATPAGGHFVISGPSLDTNNIQVRLFDFSTPLTQVRSFMGCGASIAPSGTYVTVNQGSHQDVAIWRWDSTCMSIFHMNAWAKPDEYDGRTDCYWTRHRWSANSDTWVFLVHGAGYDGTVNTDAQLYNWQDREQIRVTFNDPNGGDGSDDPEDFWVDSGPQLGLNIHNLIFMSETTLNVPVFNAGNSGTIPQVSAVPKSGVWLSTMVSGSGNQQVIHTTASLSNAARGIYYDTVTVSDPSGALPAAWYAVALMIGPFVPSTIALQPLAPWTVPGTSIQFHATILDQFGNSDTGAVLWSLPDGGGTISSAGYFTSNGVAGSYRLACRSVDATIAITTSITVAVVPTNGLFLWHKADLGVTAQNGSKVTVWQNLAASGTAAYASLDSAPVLSSDSTLGGGGMPVIRFNGHNAFNISDQPCSSFTVLCAYRPDTMAYSQHWILGGARQGISVGGTSQGYSGCGVWNATSKNPFWPEIWLQTPSAPMVFSILTLENDHLFLNGAEPSHYATKNHIPNLELQRIGCLSDTLAGGFVGEIAELIAYNRILSDQERSCAERYLRTKYRPSDPNNPIQVLSPNGGESFRVGDTMHIKWTADVNRVSQVLPLISPDMGVSWCMMPVGGSIYSSSTAWGDYSFVIPATMVDGAGEVDQLSTGKCLVQIRDYLDPTVSDESDTAFTITGSTKTKAAPAKKAVRPYAIRSGRGMLVVTTGDIAASEIFVYTLSGRTMLRQILKSQSTLMLNIGDKAKGPVIAVIRSKSKRVFEKLIVL